MKGIVANQGEFAVIGFPLMNSSHHTVLDTGPANQLALKLHLDSLSDISDLTNTRPLRRIDADSNFQRDYCETRQRRNKRSSDLDLAQTSNTNTCSHHPDVHPHRFHSSTSARRKRKERRARLSVPHLIINILPPPQILRHASHRASLTHPFLL